MLKIRLQRVGRKNIPIFRVVLTDSKNSTKSGKFLEILGTFDQVNNVKEIDAEKVKFWIGKGAQVSDTIHNFLVEKKVISGKKVNSLPRKSPIKKEEENKEVIKKEETKPTDKAPEATAVPAEAKA